MTGASLEMTVEQVQRPAASRRRADRGRDRLASRPDRSLRADPTRKMAHPDPAPGQAHPGAERSASRAGGRFPVKHGASHSAIPALPTSRRGGSYATHRCRGSWQWVLEYGRDSNGRRLQTSKAGFATKAAAQSALQQVVRTLMTDVNVTSLTVGEYLETWLTGKHALKPKTMSLYRDFTTNYLVPNLGDVRLLELRAHHLDRMYLAIALGRRGRPLSPSTIRRVHAVLRSALNTAVKRRLIPYSPADHIELAPENPKRPKPWTVEECQTFLRDIADDRLANLYHLILFTGMRRGEAIGLRWEDVDLDGACLSVVQQITEVHGHSVVGTPKTKRGTRLVPIDDSTIASLRRHRKRKRSNASHGAKPERRRFGLHAEDGRPLRPEYATRHFKP